MQPGPMEPTRMEQGLPETILAVAAVPERAVERRAVAGRGRTAEQPARRRATRYALLAHAPESGRGRYALEFVGADGTLLEVSFHESVERALAQARALAGELDWRTCGLELRSAARLDPALFERCLEG